MKNKQMIFNVLATCIAIIFCLGTMKNWEKAKENISIFLSETKRDVNKEKAESLAIKGHNSIEKKKINIFEDYIADKQAKTEELRQEMRDKNISEDNLKTVVVDTKDVEQRLTEKENNEKKIEEEKARFSGADIDE